MVHVSLHSRLVEYLTFGSIVKTLALLLLLAIVRFVYAVYQVRKYFRDAARKHGAPLMPHSWFFGHLPIIARLQTKSQNPKDEYGQGLPMQLLAEYPEMAAHGCIYIDAYPFAWPMISVFEPDMMTQYTQQKSLPKYDHHMQREFGPLSKGEDLVNLEGAEWKHWRGVFNPVFANANLMEAMPNIIEEIEVFRGFLTRAAESGEVVKLFSAITKMTMDLAGRMVMGTKLGCQTKPNTFIEAFKRQMGLLHIDNSPPQLMMAWNPTRPFHLMANNRIMRNYIKPLAERTLRHGFSEHKTITSVAAASFFRGDAKPPTTLPTHLVTKLKHHVAVFMFGGTDSVALTLSKSYDYLYNNPRVLKALIDEVDSVLGPDPSEAIAKIKANPTLLNGLPYTTAVVKETLRLSPPFGTVRKGASDFFLTHPTTGQKYPTENLMVYGTSFVSHRDEKHWPRVNEYLPERWLAREGDELHVRRNLFRPFELGPRNCVGQEMAMLEARATLALTLRDFVIESVYDEGAQEFLGEKAYQIRVAGSPAPMPKDQLPVRVRFRK